MPRVAVAKDAELGAIAGPRPSRAKSDPSIDARGRRVMRPANLVLAAIVLQAIVGLALGLPGHLSPDSIVQLYEARTLNSFRSSRR